ncbi:efflux transporter outer membrane subunit [Rhizosaccharibacter radicis]|uniref:TolC family protein n=1 Tax=Rhizosaccharibacter radicis TaxID=2782605 RepID=A0ABT1W3R2_9PROT|nr:TolC family protein [Acetobacteraceae bacterium KSS12]
MSRRHQHRIRGPWPGGDGPRKPDRPIATPARPRLLLAGLLALGGCEVGPDYHAPRLVLGPLHGAVAARGVPAAQAPSLDTWWTGFDDPTLVRLVRRALAQNLDLAAALARVQQARAGAGGAAAQLLPTVDATADATALRQSLTTPLGAATRFLGLHRDQRLLDLGISASWEIDVAGGLRRNEEAADAIAQAADADADGARVTVAADVADAYFQIRRDQARVATIQEQVATDAHLRDLVQQLRDRGVGDERQAAQAEAVLQQANAALPPLRIEIEEQLNRLDVLLGEQPGTEAAALSAPSPLPAIPAIPVTNEPTDFLRRRPDVIAAERRLAASSARIGVALSDYYPKLSLSGLVGFDSLNVNHLLTAASFQPQATGAIRWRIFDFGKVDAEVRTARGAEAEALARYRETVLRAAEDVEDSLRAVVELDIRTARLEAEVASLQRARDLSQQAFAAGAIPLTDVLDADRQLLDARDILAETRGDAVRAAVRSFRALGGGWPGAHTAPRRSAPLTMSAS